MSQIVFAQRSSEPDTPSSGKVALAYNGTANRFEGKLPNGDLVTFSAPYGASVQIAQKNVTESTTSTTFQTYQTLNLINLNVGEVYKVTWSFTFNHSSASNSMNIRHLLDASLLGSLVTKEPKDSSDLMAYTQVNYFIASSASQTIEVQYSSEVGVQSSMLRSTLEVIPTGLSSIPTG